MAILEKLKVVGGPTSVTEWISDQISDESSILDIKSKKDEIEKVLKQKNYDFTI